MAQTPIWQREYAQVRESARERLMRHHALLRSGSGRHPQQGIQLPQVTHDRRFYVFLLPTLAAKRTLTLSQMNTSAPQRSSRPDSIGHCCNASFYAKSRGLSGAADRGGALEKGRAHAPAAFE